ncbi:MAG: hypothetical protein EB009_02225 [Actinobacteria bacterium]|nr:hypothetical protein [Actinomycetota bacterium]
MQFLHSLTHQVMMMTQRQLQQRQFLRSQVQNHQRVKVKSLQLQPMKPQLALLRLEMHLAE